MPKLHRRHCSRTGMQAASAICFCTFFDMAGCGFDDPGIQLVTILFNLVKVEKN